MDEARMAEAATEPAGQLDAATVEAAAPRLGWRCACSNDECGREPRRDHHRPQHGTPPLLRLEQREVVCAVIEAHPKRRVNQFF
jgi:hypothetical protein